MKNMFFPDAKSIEQELEWRERVQSSFPTGANERRINYLRDYYQQLKEEETNK